MVNSRYRKSFNLRIILNFQNVLGPSYSWKLIITVSLDTKDKMENQPRLKKSPSEFNFGIKHTEVQSLFQALRSAELRKHSFFPPRQLFACLSLFHLPYYLRAWNRLLKYLSWFPASNLMSSFGWRLQLHSITCGSLLTKNVWFTTNSSRTSIIDHLLYKATTSHRRPLIGNTLQSETTTVGTSHKPPPLASNCADNGFKIFHCFNPLLTTIWRLVWSLQTLDTW